MFVSSFVIPSRSWNYFTVYVTVTYISRSTDFLLYLRLFDFPLYLKDYLISVIFLDNETVCTNFDLKINICQHDLYFMV